MLRWRPLFFVLIFILVLPACIQSKEGEVVNAQPLELPTETIDTIPAVMPDASAVPGLDILKDTAIVPEKPPDTCPVTQPPDPPFTPPQPYSARVPWGSEFLYGTNSLWTALPRDGVWFWLPHNPEGYTQKVWWWRKVYSWTKEPEPDLTATGRRLDADAPPLRASKATNAYADDIGSTMLVGVGIPTLGCWEITGQYADARLSFVVWVAP